MRKRVRRTQDGKLPMLELIISIGVFAIISVLLLEMFLQANSIQKNTRDQGKAITLAENVAETIKAADSLDAAVSQLGMKAQWGTVTLQEDGSYCVEDLSEQESEEGAQIYLLHYNENWEVAQQEDMYSVILMPYREAVYGKTMDNYQVYVYRLHGYPSVFHQKQNVQLYHISFSKYRQEMEE